MTTRQIVFAILGLLVTFGLVYFVVVNWGPVENEQTKFFENQVLGLSFSYPSRYKLTEREVGNAERGHYQIMLAMPETPAEPEIPREGPPAITIDIYQNNLDRQSLTDWLDTNDSNYKLAISPLTPTTILGQEAVRYTWDGLYRGDTTAFVYGSNIFALTVTYLGVEDQIRKDYEKVLSSLRLTLAEQTIKSTTTSVINFSQRGVAKKDSTRGQGEGLTLLYEKPGQPAISVKLKFDGESICVGGEQKIPCMVLSISDYGLANGRPISISGLLNGDTVTVHQLEYLGQ